MNFKRFILVSSILFFALACKKVDLELNQTELSTNLSSSIRFIENVNNKFIIGGGDRSTNGFIAEYDPVSGSISMLADSFALPVYSCTYFFGRYVFVNEAGTIFYTRNEKDFFEHILNEKDFIPSLHQQPSHQLLLNNAGSSVFNFAGGEYQYGLIQETKDTFNTWQPLIFDNEISSAVFINSSEAWAGGYGILLHSADDGKTWRRLEFDPVYITGIAFQNHQKGFMSTFEGRFYYTDNGGKDWKKSEMSGKKGYINALEILSDNLAVAVGEDGSICLSKDAGRSWQCDKELKGNDLQCLEKLSSTQAIIGGEKGKIWKVNF